jgi:hypothetical protein
MMSSWVVYSRDGCGLCHEFMTELADQIGSLAETVRVIDVDADPELRRRYGDRVPVLVVDDAFVCAVRVDRERIDRLLA